MDELVDGGVTLGVVCMHCSHDKQANIRKYEKFIEEAGKRGARLLVFPEVSLQGFVTKLGTALSKETLAQLDYYEAEAETIPGPTTEHIGALAKEYGMIVQIGMAEVDRAGTCFYNSVALVGPHGLIGVGRKVHNQREFPVFGPGDGFPVFDTDVGRLGPFICADLNYPESTRILALRGAHILTMSTAYPMEGENPEGDPHGRMYEIQGQAQAMVNQVWVLQANQVKRPPREGAQNYYGHSRIVSPFGEVVASCGYEEALVTAKVDVLGEIRRHKRVWGNFIMRRRPELYGILASSRH